MSPILTHLELYLFLLVCLSSFGFTCGKLILSIVNSFCKYLQGGVTLSQTCWRGFQFLMSPHLPMLFLLRISQSKKTLRLHLKFMMVTLTMVVACTCSLHGPSMFGMMWVHMPTSTIPPLWRISEAPMNCHCGANVAFQGERNFVYPSSYLGLHVLF